MSCIQERAYIARKAVSGQFE
jgi:hypothetical protein